MGRLIRDELSRDIALEREELFGKLPKRRGSQEDESVRSATGRIRPKGELADWQPIRLRSGQDSMPPESSARPEIFAPVLLPILDNRSLRRFTQFELIAHLL
jgi:hypothetical protein